MTRPKVGKDDSNVNKTEALVCPHSPVVEDCMPVGVRTDVPQCPGAVPAGLALPVPTIRAIKPLPRGLSVRIWWWKMEKVCTATSRTLTSTNVLAPGHGAYSWLPHGSI